MPTRRYYKILGLSDGASEQEVRRAYRKLAMQYHPDKNPSVSAERKFLEITEAYEVLTGKRPPPVSQHSARPHQPNTGAEQRKAEHEQRVKEAQKRYEEQKMREFLENELYFRKLTSGIRWKVMKFSAVVGIFLTSLLILDRFLPHHYVDDEVISYSINRAKGESGSRISLVELESGSRFWISQIRYSLVSEYPKVFIEQSWIFHNPIQLVSKGKVEYRYYPIHFRFYRHTWLLIILFMLPLITILIKRRTISYTVLYNFTYFGVNGIMIFFLITGDRWAHLLTLGFY